MTQQTQDYTAWIGHQVIDTAGEKIGKVSSIFVDDQTRQPEWFVSNASRSPTRPGMRRRSGDLRRGGDPVTPAWGLRLRNLSDPGPRPRDGLRLDALDGVVTLVTVRHQEISQARMRT
jgi:hypothetical protein